MNATPVYFSLLLGLIEYKKDSICVCYHYDAIITLWQILWTNSFLPVKLTKQGSEFNYQVKTCMKFEHYYWQLQLKFADFFRVSRTFSEFQWKRFFSLSCRGFPGFHWTFVILKILYKYPYGSVSTINNTFCFTITSAILHIEMM